MHNQSSLVQQAQVLLFGENRKWVPGDDPQIFTILGFIDSLQGAYQLMDEDQDEVPEDVQALPHTIICSWSTGWVGSFTLKGRVGYYFQLNANSFTTVPGLYVVPQ